MELRNFWNVERNGSLLMDKREQRSNSLEDIGDAGSVSGYSRRKMGWGGPQGYLKVCLLNNCCSQKHSTLSH